MSADSLFEHFSCSEFINYINSVIDCYARGNEEKYSDIRKDLATLGNRISDEKLEEVIGGASVSGTIINAFTNVIKVLIDAGIGVGSAIRRVHDDKLCPLE